MRLITLRTVLKVSLPILVSLALITACSKDDSPPATQTVAPSPVPTPFGARTDCPPTWAYYNDPLDRFSFCYPADLKFVTDANAGDRYRIVGVYPPVYRPAGHHLVSFYWRFATPYLCYQDLGYTQTMMDTRTIAGRVVDTCTTSQYKDGGLTDLNHKTLQAQVPVTSGGVIQVRVQAAGVPIEIAEAAGFAILDTLVVR